MTRLVLIRHGEAQTWVDQVVGGHEGCTGLSDLGRRQAEALRDRLAASGELAEASVLLTSVLPRAIETAEIIAPALRDVKIDQHCELCEQHPGEADGMLWTEFQDRYGEPVPGLAGHFQPWAPGAESWADFMLRTSRMLWQVASDHEDQTVVIACHGGVIAASFHAFGNLPLWRPFHLASENTSLTEWRTGQDDEDPRWVLARYNDVGHLAGLS